MPKQSYPVETLPNRLEPLVEYKKENIKVQMFPKAGQIPRHYNVTLKNKVVVTKKRSEVNLIWNLN